MTQYFSLYSWLFWTIVFRERATHGASPGKGVFQNDDDLGFLNDRPHVCLSHCQAFTLPMPVVPLTPPSHECALLNCNKIPTFSLSWQHREIITSVCLPHIQENDTLFPLLPKTRTQHYSPLWLLGGHDVDILSRSQHLSLPSASHQQF